MGLVVSESDLNVGVGYVAEFRIARRCQGETKGIVLQLLMGLSLTRAKSCAGCFDGAPIAKRTHSAASPRLGGSGEWIGRIIREMELSFIHCGRCGFGLIRLMKAMSSWPQAGSQVLLPKSTV